MGVFILWRLTLSLETPASWPEVRHSHSIQGFSTSAVSLPQKPGNFPEMRSCKSGDWIESLASRLAPFIVHRSWASGGWRGDAERAGRNVQVCLPFHIQCTESITVCWWDTQWKQSFLRKRGVNYYQCLYLMNCIFQIPVSNSHPPCHKLFAWSIFVCCNHFVHVWLARFQILLEQSVHARSCRQTKAALGLWENMGKTASTPSTVLPLNPSSNPQSSKNSTLDSVEDGAEPTPKKARKAWVSVRQSVQPGCNTLSVWPTCLIYLDCICPDV